jgi:hypothetical protein
MHQTLLESCSQLENMLEPAESCQQQAGRQAGRQAGMQPATKMRAPDRNQRRAKKKKRTNEQI